MKIQQSYYYNNNLIHYKFKLIEIKSENVLINMISQDSNNFSILCRGQLVSKL